MSSYKETSHKASVPLGAIRFGGDPVVRRQGPVALDGAPRPVALADRRQAARVHLVRQPALVQRPQLARPVQHACAIACFAGEPRMLALPEESSCRSTSNCLALASSFTSAAAVVWVLIMAMASCTAVAGGKVRLRQRCTH